MSLHPDPNPISSWHALYLAVGQSYSVLRAWKKTPSPLADRWILRPQSQLHRSLKQLNADFLAPVPQRVQRSWSLGRSPAQQLSEFFAKWLSLPTESVLEINAGSTPQAQLSLQERLERPGPFEMRRPWRDLISGKTVLLVDDFITSGRTLRNAALVLKRAGVKEVHVACLAIRPGKTNDPS